MRLPDGGERPAPIAPLHVAAGETRRTDTQNAMTKITLPNGNIVETDDRETVALLLGLAPAPTPTTPAPTTHAPAAPDDPTVPAKASAPADAPASTARLYNPTPRELSEILASAPSLPGVVLPDALRLWLVLPRCVFRIDDNFRGAVQRQFARLGFPLFVSNRASSLKNWVVGRIDALCAAGLVEHKDRNKFRWIRIDGSLLDAAEMLRMAEPAIREYKGNGKAARA